MLLEYAYFVKCPNCADEQFNAFEDAKNCAMGCLSKQPIITQVEICRNDFGECTDSSDLGTIWSWEDTMRDVTTDDTCSTFSKSETIDCDNTDYFNCEFDDLDKVPDNYCRPAGLTEEMSDFQAKFINRLPRLTKAEFSSLLDSQNGDELRIFYGDPREPGVRSREIFVSNFEGPYEVTYVDFNYMDDYEDPEPLETFNSLDELWDYMVNLMEDADYSPEYNFVQEQSSRTPVPEDMSIDDLVEAMEENEDDVECKRCTELFDKSECVYDKDYRGWLCSGCQRAVFDHGADISIGHAPLEEAAVRPQGNPRPRLTHTYRNIIRYSTPEAAREAIYLSLETAPYPVPMMVRGEGLDADFEEKIYMSTSNAYNKVTGKVTDFFIKEDGTIEVLVVKNNREYRMPMKYALRDNTKFNTEELLIAICQGAMQYDLSVRPTAAERGARQVAERDEAVLQMLRGNDAVARELRDHIVDIEFLIPLDDDYEYTLDSSDEAYEAACNRLERIQTRFNNLPGDIAARAVAAGLVKNRVITPGTKVRHVAQRWQPECTVYFDCELGTIPKCKDMIEASQVATMVTDERANLTHATSASCYRLAVALIRYFNNDVEFFRHKGTNESLTEAVTSWNSEPVELEYLNLPVTLQGPKCDVDDWDEEETFVTHTYEVDANDVVEVLWNDLMTEEDVASIPGGFDKLYEDDEAFNAFMEENFESLVDKYSDALLDHFESAAAADYEENHGLYESFESEGSEMTACPECGVEEVYDHVNGFCTSCGFASIKEDYSEQQAAIDSGDYFELYYNDLPLVAEFTEYGPQTVMGEPDSGVSDWERTVKVSYTYKVPSKELVKALIAIAPELADDPRCAVGSDTFDHDYIDDLINGGKYSDQIYDYFQEYAEEQVHEDYLAGDSYLEDQVERYMQDLEDRYLDGDF
jgi:hypothetical protein